MTGPRPLLSRQTHRPRRAAGLVGLIWVCLGASAHAEPLRSAEQPIVYGDDDRVEVHQHPEEAVQRLARESAVTLMARSALDFRTDGTVALRTMTPLSRAQNLCSGERFAEQPTTGFCSGTLIAPNLVLTAGHCISPSDGRCSNTAFVFGYTQEANGLRTLQSDDVYTCQSVVAHANTTSGGRTLDYAVVQLDRPATPRFTPARVRAGNAALATGQRVVMIGSPSGLPLKIDDGGRVRNGRSSTLDYFVATTDSFGGNSGSGIFLRETLELVGILVSGDTDYVQSGSCYRVNRCSETGCGGENSTYAFRAIEAACGSVTDAVLCNTESRCGDGFCSFDESPSTCPADCQAPVCGDGRCEGDEWQSCPDDCDFSAPPSWTCPDEYYGTMDGCDCDCGAPDPDCEIDNSSFDCGLFGTCSADGTCQGGLGGFCASSGDAPAREVAARSITGMALFALLGVWWWSRRRPVLRSTAG